jgi:hypothetical protein
VQALNGAPEAAQRPVGMQDDGASRGEQHEAGNAHKTGVYKSGTGLDADQHRWRGQQRQRKQGSHVDERDGGKPLTVLSGSSPAAESISN